MQTYTEYIKMQQWVFVGLPWGATALKGKSQAVKENINWSYLAVHSCRGGYYRSNKDVLSVVIEVDRKLSLGEWSNYLG